MDPNFHSMFSGDASSFDPMFSGVSLQSLLTLNPSLFTNGFPNLASLTDVDPPQLNLPEPTETPNLKEKKLLVPKNENHHNHPYPSHLPIEEFLAQQPFNFFPKYQPYDHSSAFHRLPQLRSPETSYPAERKRLRLDPTADSAAAAAVRGKAPSVIPQSNLARQRRQKLSEKTRCLQKLMPWDTKMDQATLMEEACKYVKFLQAQFCVLQSMPSQTSPFLAAVHNNGGGGGGGGGVFGDLERLNRNQVLQVLVNSPVAQTMLYSQGLCVFSMEQLALLTQLYDRKQQMSDNASSKTFFN
ncbi:transcription factor bHLH117 [Gastrolobium bilobum]|uniref:transcription factor bHLH117 n=1 Tax=Gastrolobium bilobum TaxID=150636 RepID=UPI002AB12700|nr:transcription factor bHLH117 [Gastrolobium bilobum]